MPAAAKGIRILVLTLVLGAALFTGQVMAGKSICPFPAGDDDLEEFAPPPMKYGLAVQMIESGGTMIVKETMVADRPGIGSQVSTMKMVGTGGSIGYASVAEGGFLDLMTGREITVGPARVTGMEGLYTSTQGMVDNESGMLYCSQAAVTNQFKLTSGSVASAGLTTPGFIQHGATVTGIGSASYGIRQLSMIGPTDGPEYISSMTGQYRTMGVIDLAAGYQFSLGL